MCYEIEAKLKVDSFLEITEKLKLLKAEFIEEQIQKDDYFDTEDENLRRDDSGLRLRKQFNGQIEKLFLTYKGPREQDKFKKRQEIEIKVDNADLTEKMLMALGLIKTVVVEKKRNLWQIEQCVIALDQVKSLGNFVEIEGPDDKKIADIQKALGLAGLTHIKVSYANLMAQKFEQIGKE